MLNNQFPVSKNEVVQECLATVVAVVVTVVVVVIDKINAKIPQKPPVLLLCFSWEKRRRNAACFRLWMHEVHETYFRWSIIRNANRPSHNMHDTHSLFNNVKWRSAKCNWYMVVNKSKTDANNETEAKKMERKLKKHGYASFIYQTVKFAKMAMKRQHPVLSHRFHQYTNVYHMHFKNVNITNESEHRMKCQVKTLRFVTTNFVPTKYRKSYAWLKYLNISVVCAFLFLSSPSPVWNHIICVVCSMFGCHYQCTFTGFRNYSSNSFLLIRVCKCTRDYVSWCLWKCVFAIG